VDLDAEGERGANPDSTRQRRLRAGSAGCNGRSDGVVAPCSRALRRRGGSVRPFAASADLRDNRDMTATHPVDHPASVTVYGADWCGDCRRSKRLLVERETEFVWVDVAAHREIRDELTANGYPAIPVIALPDGTILMEPSDEALSAALDAIEASVAR
jgi:mycoredoxin